MNRVEIRSQKKTFWFLFLLEMPRCFAFSWRVFHRDWFHDLVAGAWKPAFRLDSCRGLCTGITSVFIECSSGGWPRWACALVWRGVKHTICSEHIWLDRWTGKSNQLFFCTFSTGLIRLIPSFCRWLWWNYTSQRIHVVSSKDRLEKFFQPNVLSQARGINPANLGAALSRKFQNRFGVKVKSEVVITWSVLHVSAWGQQEQTNWCVHGGGIILYRCSSEGHPRWWGCCFFFWVLDGLVRAVVDAQTSGEACESQGFGGMNCNVKFSNSILCLSWLAGCSSCIGSSGRGSSKQHRWHNRPGGPREPQTKGSCSLFALYSLRFWTLNIDYKWVVVGQLRKANRKADL